MSVLLALLANAHRDPKKTKPLRPRDFDPFAQRIAAERVPRVDISVLRDVFIDGRFPGHGGPGSQ
ncbi:MAG: hypothetical protein IPM64_10690 [Phycisphaerales bacterium]|nr:hypothetical protein [Phycisphaerales bacterium]